MKVGEGAGGFDTAIVERVSLQLTRIACCEMWDSWYDLNGLDPLYKQKSYRFHLVKWRTIFRFATSSLPFCVTNSAEFRICASDV